MSPMHIEAPFRRYNQQNLYTKLRSHKYTTRFVCGTKMADCLHHLISLKMRRADWSVTLVWLTSPTHEFLIYFFVLFRTLNGVEQCLSTHHFLRNACTNSGSLRFSQFSGCWLILSVYILMSFDFPFVRLFGVR